MEFKSAIADEISANFREQRHTRLFTSVGERSEESTRRRYTRVARVPPFLQTVSPYVIEENNNHSLPVSSVDEISPGKIMGAKEQSYVLALIRWNNSKL